MLHFIDRMVSFLFQAVIFIYQKIISPFKLFLFGPTCRFTPTCSQYTFESFQNYPVPIALYLSLKRILRCHPFHEGGEDPLPKEVHIKLHNKIFTFPSKKIKNPV